MKPPLKGIYVFDSCKREILDMVAVAKALDETHLTFVQLAHLEKAITEVDVDFVILPFCRPQLLEVCKYLKSMDVFIFVFDNEGGVYESSKKYFDKVDKKTTYFVDEFWLWGSELSDTFTAHGIQNRVTGRPRFTLLFQLRELLTDMIEPTSDLLVNTSYSLCAPKYLSLEDERRVWIKNGEDVQRLDVMIDQQAKFRASLLKDLEATSRKVLVRVHPFEDAREYFELANRKNNIQMSSSLLVITDILKSKVIAQRGCTTAIEAALLGKPVLKLDYSDYPLALPAVESVQTYISESLNSIELSGFERNREVPINSYIDFRVAFDSAFKSALDGVKPAQPDATWLQKEKIRFGFHRYRGWLGLVKFFLRFVFRLPINKAFFSEASQVKEFQHLRRLVGLEIFDQQGEYYKLSTKAHEMLWPDLLEILILKFEVA